jgi:hypothetical protein
MVTPPYGRMYRTFRAPPSHMAEPGLTAGAIPFGPSGLLLLKDASSFLGARFLHCSSCIFHAPP